jgi:hypothetical protein
MPTVVPEIDLGYRWVFGRFLMGVGGMLGAAVVVAHDATDRQTGVVEERKKGAYPIGEMVFDIGIVL